MAAIRQWTLKDIIDVLATGLADDDIRKKGLVCGNLDTLGPKTQKSASLKNKIGVLADYRLELGKLILMFDIVSRGFGFKQVAIIIGFFVLSI